ncbi:hypothetical protein GALL_512580 [mine drainage metagenome]|uniref:Uncharacterized protein n=1 Tax=mine drainage metagenome TaxID=410659 RepID=A0A1J5P7G2_9ZZZZ
MRTVSVTSTMILDGSQPLSCTACWSIGTRSGSLSCRAETLRLTTWVPDAVTASRAAAWQACCATHRPSSTICPVRSATSMNDTGLRRPTPGRSHRTRASTPETSSVARLTIGWKRNRSSSCVIPCCRSFARRKPDAAPLCMEGAYQTARSRPVSLAVRSASIAAASSPLPAARVSVTRPELTVSRTASPPTRKGGSSAAATAARDTSSPATGSSRSTTQTNASACQRPTVPSPAADVSRRASSARISSAASGP